MNLYFRPAISGMQNAAGRNTQLYAWALAGRNTQLHTPTDRDAIPAGIRAGSQQIMTESQSLKWQPYLANLNCANTLQGTSSVDARGDPWGRMAGTHTDGFASFPLKIGIVAHRTVGQ